MRGNPHLNFAGDCAEAFEAYARILEAEISFRVTFAETPVASAVPAEWRGKILHMALSKKELTLTGADAPPGQYERPQGFAVALNIGSEVEAERIFAALAQEGHVRMPLQATFWARRFGMVTDRYGTPWMINCGQA